MKSINNMLKLIKQKKANFRETDRFGYAYIHMGVRKKGSDKY